MLRRTSLSKTTLRWISVGIFLLLLLIGWLTFFDTLDRAPLLVYEPTSLANTKWM